jgi:heme-degrading monooxygenase HmoA
MSGQILTAVTATVDANRESELTSGFRKLTAAPMPDGLIRTELLRGQNGSWRIQTLWRDRAALEAVRASPEPPAALELFRSVGADHSHEVFSVEHAHHPGSASCGHPD